MQASKAVYLDRGTVSMPLYKFGSLEPALHIKSRLFCSETSVVVANQSAGSTVLLSNHSVIGIVARIQCFMYEQ